MDVNEILNGSKGAQFYQYFSIFTAIQEWMSETHISIRLVAVANQILLGILKGNLTNFIAIVSRAPTRQSCKTVFF